MRRTSIRFSRCGVSPAGLAFGSGRRVGTSRASWSASRCSSPQGRKSAIRISATSCSDWSPRRPGHRHFTTWCAIRSRRPLGIDGVFRARTRRDQRLPGEGFYDQPGTGLTPEFPDREVRAPLPYGGEGWLTESMTAGGGLAASAGAVARMIGHYAVWGLGLRRANQNWARSGAMAGTSSLAISRPADSTSASS